MLSKGCCRTLIRGWIAAICFLCALLPSPTARAAAAEDTLRAVFLFRLVSFIEWPADTFSAPGDPFHLCVLGDHAVHRILAEKTQDSLVFGHRLKIHDLQQAGATSAAGFVCQLSYVSSRKEDSFKALDSIHKKALGLVVSQDRQLLTQGAALAIVAQQGASGSVRLVFYGSRKQLASHAAKLNARLLRIVRFDQP